MKIEINKGQHGQLWLICNDSLRGPATLAKLDREGKCIDSIETDCALLLRLAFLLPGAIPRVEILEVGELATQSAQRAHEIDERGVPDGQHAPE